MTNLYLKLTLNDVADVDSDWVSSELFDLGAQGVSENLKFIQTSQQYDPEILSQDMVSLQAFFSIDAKEAVESFLMKAPYCDMGGEVEIEKNKDWLEEWKKHYKPFSITDSLWVYPAWEAEQAAEQEGETLLIDPGLAFGTGTHATTYLCLEALSHILQEDHGFRSALDMGAGTGILSVLISKRNVEHVDACEIDEMARDKCRDNLKLNQCDRIVVLSPEDLEPEGSYDLVVANIIDGVLLKLKKDLVQRTKQKIVLSGILLENEEHVLQEFLAEGLKLVARTSRDEWACLVFDKQA